LLKFQEELENKLYPTEMGRKLQKFKEYHVSNMVMGKEMILT
jgi:hypothetical protein